MASLSDLLDSRTATNRFAAQVLEITPARMKLLSRWAMPPGLQMLVELPHPKTGQPVGLVMANLLQAKSLMDGKWELTCQFATELTDEDLRPFARQITMPQPESREQRRGPRFACKAPAFYQVLRYIDTHNWPGEVTNISANGLAMLVRQALDVGTTLRVEIGPALRLTACVVRLDIRSAKEWLVGCNFLRRLSDKEIASVRDR
jgi:hypothetical protein